MAKAKSVLVVGAVGPLGSYLAEEIERFGYRVMTLIWDVRRSANLSPTITRLAAQLNQVSTLSLPLSRVESMVIISGELHNLDNMPMELDFESLKNIILSLEGRKIPTVLLTAADSVDASSNHITAQSYHQMRISELLVQSSGLPYTIIRMHNAFPGLARHKHFVASPLEAPDKTTRRHSLSCRQIGAIAANCLFNQDAQGKSFELFADDNGTTDNIADFLKSIPANKITPEQCFEDGKSWVEPDIINSIYFTRENLNRNHNLPASETSLF